jgi:hypothetical protein
MDERHESGVVASPVSRRTAFSTPPAAIAKALSREGAEARADAMTPLVREVRLGGNVGPACCYEVPGNGSRMERSTRSSGLCGRMRRDQGLEHLGEASGGDARPEALNGDAGTLDQQEQFIGEKLGIA